MAGFSSSINIGLPQTPRLSAQGNEQVHGEFQLVYNAVRNLWEALSTFVENGGGGGGTGEATWGSITGSLATQTDLWNVLQTNATNISNVAARTSALELAMPGKLSDAPNDTNIWARSGGAWVVVTSGGGGGIPEAPNDGKLYGRQSLAWVEIPAGGSGGIPEAPLDGQDYVRSNGTWKLLPVTPPPDPAPRPVLPVVTGIPPQLVYTPDGQLVYHEI